MFHTLERTAEQSARRGWSTLASFGFQAMALSLLLLVPLFSIQRPPRLQWLPTVMAPPPPPPTPAVVQEQASRTTSSNVAGQHLIEPRAIPPTIAILNETPPPAPDIDQITVPGGTGNARSGVLRSIGPSVDTFAPPPRPAPTRPLRISHWSEGNLVYRVEPVYPEIARQARIQGPVVLRAIISKKGAIENITVESGHPTLVAAAIKAVKRWRYRPYLLNGEPIEVETEITVNFVIAGN